ncbi:hypothetical protein [Aeromonas sp. FDAARGOS 1407]|uniref:hypothetical protein n=1 Tax=Aeromonas TaxID=642 RepID=UPI001C232F72|nr:hypothetical protein [Aeromonas sp. FDAARGOS 1407]QXC36166.1 hypothetical protein I6L37_11205 [Aeromonas sp. FDAARGOS 1407]
MKFSEAIEFLATACEQKPGVEPLDFASTGTYRQFVDAAELAGFTGPDVDMDSGFAERTPEWVWQASELELQRWVHTLIRADRWNEECPDAVLMACRSGCLGVLAERLAS